MPEPCINYAQACQLANFQVGDSGYNLRAEPPHQFTISFSDSIRPDERGRRHLNLEWNDSTGMHRSRRFFEDPERIARRLATLGKEHQIIVFTHSIAFLLELERYATELSTPMTKLYIAKTGAGAGHCGAEAEPWEKLRIKERVKAFKAEVTRLRTEHAKAPQGRDYARSASMLCGDIRAAWERAVEELILNEVVERFGYAVQTKRLKGVVCSDETYKVVNDAITRLSAITEAHDHAKGAFASCPNPDELDEFVTNLGTFAKEQEAKRDKAQAARKALEKPPAPATVTPILTVVGS